MAFDYRQPDFNQRVLVHEMQPAPTQFYPCQLHHNPQILINRSKPSFEMTAASVGNACGEVTLPSQILYEPRKRKSPSFLDFELNEKVCSNSESSIANSKIRKKKMSSFGSASTFENEGSEEACSSRNSNLPDKKQNHSEIEKRRRDKMNTYITELSSMVPMCGAITRKLDKLTVLRMAVQHLRSVRGSLASCPLTARPRPAFVSEKELNGLIVQASNDSFLLVVSCDRGRLLYVSQSVKNMLNFDQAELVGQSMFDILHPKDVTKVKEQLSSSDLSPRERLIDAKTMLPVKADVVAGTQRLCPGARRSFLCRMKCKQSPETESVSANTPASVNTEPESPPTPVKEETINTKLRKKNEKKYCVVQCTGYLKSWVPADEEKGSSPEGDDDQSAVSCLVAIGRTLPELVALPPPSSERSTRLLQYVSRHAIDGKFLYVDQRVTLALGFLPQELLGTSLYEYVSASDMSAVARAHKQALMRRDQLFTPPYSILRKDGSVATIQTNFKPFRNPWTKEVECLLAKNTILVDSRITDDAQLHYEAFKQTDEWRDYLTGIKDPVKEDSEKRGGASAQDATQRDHDNARPLNSEGDADVQRLIDSQMESHKIGSAIADEALGRPPLTAYSSPAVLLQDPVFNNTLMDNILGVELDGDVSPSSSLETTPSPPLAPLALDGNGEAAMAVIMSLLEADAGLGGSVNFTGLPWPLP